MDIARADRELAFDPRPSLERDHELFTECTALLQLAEVEAMLEEIRPA
jgi:hypothetical protein